MRQSVLAEARTAFRSMGVCSSSATTAKVLQVCLLVTAKIATDSRATPCTKRALDHPALMSLFSHRQCTQHHEVVGVLLNHPGEQSEGVRLTRLSRTRDGSVRKECDRSDTLRCGARAPRPTGHFWVVRWARVPFSERFVDSGEDNVISLYLRSVKEDSTTFGKIE